MTKFMISTDKILKKLNLSLNMSLRLMLLSLTILSYGMADSGGRSVGIDPRVVSVSRHNNGGLSSPMSASLALSKTPPDSSSGWYFNRIATFLACEQTRSGCENDKLKTAAEIVAASKDGMTLIYSDSPGHQVGFVDITDASKPKGLGTVALNGEPTSVSVWGDYAVVAVNTSKDYVSVGGELAVIDIASRQVVKTHDLGGQPDSIAVSKDQNFIAVVIENERDEDLGDGIPNQAPPGYVVVVDSGDMPANWTLTKIDLTDLSMPYADDPEPEYVDINSKNQAVITLQENNHIVLLDLASKTIMADFTAGSADLTQIDTIDEKPHYINLSGKQKSRLREPDGVSWIDDEYFITADEGDLNGGSRGFTVFNQAGQVIWEAGNLLEHLTVRLGHYNDKRSDAKGNEPENVEVGVYGDERYAFINSERSSLIFVFTLNDPTRPQFVQALPAQVGPEGGLAIPTRDLLVIASEEDARGDKMRAAINIYQRQFAEPTYPTLVSENGVDGLPIPWAAISGLTADKFQDNILYAVNDSFFAANSIFKIDVSHKPAKITAQIKVRDSEGVLASTPLFTFTGDSKKGADNDFDAKDRAALVNQDKTVNLDLEGISQAADSGFWLAHEGNGTINDVKRPLLSPNFLIKTDGNGVIEQVVQLPEEMNAKQVRFGFEGVSVDGDHLVVTMQRKWIGENHPKIAVYNTVTATWTFADYKLDNVTSPAGGWVGLSDITRVNPNKFLVIERDNQANLDARIKAIYAIDISSLLDTQSSVKTVTKVLNMDLMPALESFNGSVLEKIEGLALDKAGNVWIVNDNDGVDDHNGETQLVKLTQTKR